MIISFVLSYFKRSPRFVWSPAIDLKDQAIRSTLIPGAQY